MPRFSEKNSEEISQITLPTFTGPLDLLLHLVEKNKINLIDIPIAEMTAQYMEFLRQFPEDMENRSAFLVMAATLLEIKSRMLLPRQTADKDVKDPRDELAQKLVAYKFFKEMSERLRHCESLGARFYYRQPDKETHERFSGKAKPQMRLLFLGVEYENFYQTYAEVTSRKENRSDKVRSGFRTISKEERSIEEEIKYIQEWLKRSGRLVFSRLLYERPKRSEKVALFLALLELSKMNQIEILQENVFTEIVVLYLKSCT